MWAFSGLAALVLVAGLAGGSAEAAQGTEPAELPPAGYSGNQYVDSKGCVFLRAGLGETTTWVARLGRDRKPVCGYAPTPTAAAAPAASAPATEPAATERPATETTAAAKPAVVSAKSAAPRARKPAPVAAEHVPLALVATKRVSRDATYCTGGGSAAHRYLLSDGKRVTRCSSTNDEALAFINGLGAPGLTVSDRIPTARETRRALTAEAGAYRVTWSQGKLTGTEDAPAAAAAGPGAYVQIGAFAKPANADRAVLTAKQLGLPASAANGGGLRVILAGPFASEAALSDALALLRQNGYGDAFARRG
ncbi:MAG TPA: SPOR domain-containing protein [Albidovulum sp.]|nr:SPOR domain-containing protein [Albidovulum sp.]